jgi:cytochrome c-type biogenesis protein CcmE
MKTKQKRRLALVGSLVLVGGALLYMILGSFQQSLVFFLTPTEVMAKGAESDGRKFRLAGQVALGSLQRDEGDALAIAFDITDGTHTIPVTYRGIVPDLFAEGQMAVAEGRMEEGAFKAEMIMAKHSEDYDPDKVHFPEVHTLAPEQW